jgi:hypothetical protein
LVLPDKIYVVNIIQETDWGNASKININAVISLIEVGGNTVVVEIVSDSKPGVMECALL